MGLLQSNHSKMPLVTRPQLDGHVYMCGGVCVCGREREREREIRSTYFNDLFWDPIVTINNS